ncbi:MAG: hypothetical protein ACYS8W_05250 [Planctomycetota bacterium]|jgi:hypothetical protein
MAKTSLTISILTVVMLSGCAFFSSGSYDLKGEANLLISDVLAPDLMYVGEAGRYRKVSLLGIAPMDENHENYERVMKALLTLKGTEITVRYPGRDFWRNDTIHVLIYYDRPHEILPETGSSLEDTGTLLNAYILRHGFGRYNSEGQKIPDRISRQLRLAQNEAKSSGLGVWERAKLAK